MVAFNGATNTKEHSINDPTTQIDSNRVAHSTEQQYSTLQHHTVSPTTDSYKMSHTVTPDQQQYSTLQHL